MTPEELADLIDKEKASMAANHVHIWNALLIARDTKCYTESSFRKFIAARGFSHSWCYNGINTVVALNQFQIEGIEPGRLKALANLKLCTEEWVEKARLLPETAWKDSLREVRGLVTSDACTHPADKRKTVTQCLDCRKWLPEGK